MRRLRRMRSGLVGLRFRLRRSLLYIVGRLPLLLEHDPEKWNPVFPKSIPSGLARGSYSTKMLERQSIPSEAISALGTEIKQ